MKLARPIFMPQLGQTVEVATLVRWIKKEGENIKKGDILFELETDKAILESESFQDGILLKIFVAENESVPVKSVVGYVGDKDDKIPEIAENILTNSKVNKIDINVANKIDISVDNKIEEINKIQHPQIYADPEILPLKINFISPRAKILCKNKCIDYTKIKGTVKRDRIIEQDVVNYMSENEYNLISITPTAKILVNTSEIDLIELSNYYRRKRLYLSDVQNYIKSLPKPLSNNRQIISKRLTTSAREIPHFNLTVSVDMTDINEIKDQYNHRKKIYSINSFIMKSVVFSLSKYALINSTTLDGKNIKINSRVNLGIAVAVNNDLFVPVIFDAHLKSLLHLNKEANDLIAKASNGQLSPNELNGSTFTISNLGMKHVEEFNAIINPGNGAILAVSSVIKKPVVFKNKIIIRDTMKATLSADHRVMDGAIVADFMNDFRSNLENKSIW